MRVLHISNDYYNSGVYGTLHEGHLRHGLDSVFFVPMTQNSPEGNRQHVIEAHCFKPADRFLYMNKQRKIYQYFREAVCRHKPDLNHGYFLFSGGIHCLWAKREFGIPYVITVQNTDINSIFRYFVHLRPLGRKILQEAEKVFFISDAYRRFTLEHMVRPKDRAALEQKSCLVPFALDPFWTQNSDTTSRESHEGSVRLLTVGNVSKLKTQLTTMEAVRLLREREIDAELTVIGPTLDTEIDRKLRECPFVHRIDKLPKEELIGYYRQADLFVLPSLTESFGLVYAEALSQGLPVLYSAGQGFDMQFPEGFVGYRVDAQSAESVANAVCRALNEKTQLQKNCAAAAEKFSQDAVCSMCEDLYLDVLKQKEKK